MRISTRLDKLFPRQDFLAMGPNWIRDSTGSLEAASTTADREVEIDLANINFVTLFDWVSTVALIEPILSNPHVSTVAIDVVGSGETKVMPREEYMKAVRDEPWDPDFTQQDFALSDRVYQVLGFTEALGTREVLNNRASRTASLFFPQVNVTELDLRNYYTAKDFQSQTVVMGLTRIDTKEDCRQFLDAHRILSWRNAMGERFQRSPLFESEEIWRVLCHELAVNIWEHAKVPGFIAARVVRPFHEGKLRPWCEATFRDPLGPLINSMREGFLELCVVDAGPGFNQTLRETYRLRSGLPDNGIHSTDVLSFAFDEFGTSKDSDESWATERHALGRILQIVAKYGGALNLRSGGAEVLYRSEGGRFERIPNHLGYVPFKTKITPDVFGGSQIQLILPLIPLLGESSAKAAKSVLNVSLPDSFRVQSDQVRGHFIPLLEELGQTSASVGATEQRTFRQSCEELSRKLLRRPRTEPLVLDFGGLEWSPGQFETLLHLLQNVLQNRPVLLVEIEPKLAEEVDDLERESAATRLDKALLGTKSLSSNDLSEEVFLETFSRVHAPVLGLDQDGRRFLYGILSSRYKEPLIGLIDQGASIEEMCDTRRGSALKESALRAILNRTNSLFELEPSSDSKRRWRCVWSPQSLANEASRAMSRHFDEVAERSGAWRGRTGD